MTDKQMLIKYADVIAKYGVNVQKNQIIIINAEISSLEFIRILVECLYSLGAKEVIILWKDVDIEHTKYSYMKCENFVDTPQWMLDFYNYYDRHGAGYINIVSPNYDKVNHNCLQSKIRMNKAFEDHFSNLFVKNPSCTALVPTYSWAKKLYPHMCIEEAMDKLWNEIFKVSRITNFHESFEVHLKTMNEYAAYLNHKSLKKLYFQNSYGTKLSVELPKNHVWRTGCCKTKNGIDYCINIPSEELYTVPKRNGVNGVFKSTIPIEIDGVLIPDIEFIFERGKLSSYTCSENIDVLEKILEIDSGAKYLGEIALVFKDNGTRCSLYNSLVDENNYCHFALGNAYLDCLKDGRKKSLKKLIGEGVNLSSIHIDFMMETEKMNIFGESDSGEMILFMRDGQMEKILESTQFYFNHS